MSHRLQPVLWPLLLAAVTIAGTLATACMMPFVALGVVAAASGSRGQTVLAVAGAWAVNQLLGFGLLGYPLDGYALAWGTALGGAALATALGARIVLGGRAGLARAMIVFVAAFAAFETLLFAFALVAGGTAMFAPAIVARLFADEAGWLAVLMALRAVLATRWPALRRASAA